MRVQVGLGQYGLRSDQMVELMFTLRVSHRVTSVMTHPCVCVCTLTHTHTHSHPFPPLVSVFSCSYFYVDLKHQLECC